MNEMNDWWIVAEYYWCCVCVCVAMYCAILYWRRRRRSDGCRQKILSKFKIHTHTSCLKLQWRPTSSHILFNSISTPLDSGLTYQVLTSINFSPSILLLGGAEEDSVETSTSLSHNSESLLLCLSYPSQEHTVLLMTFESHWWYEETEGQHWCIKDNVKLKNDDRWFD